MSCDTTVDRREFVTGAAAIGLVAVSGRTNDPQQGDEREDPAQDEGSRPADEGVEGETTTLRMTVEDENDEVVEGATVAIEGEESETEQDDAP